MKALALMLCLAWLLVPEVHAQDAGADAGAAPPGPAPVRIVAPAPPSASPALPSSVAPLAQPEPVPSSAPVLQQTPPRGLPYPGLGGAGVGAGLGDGAGDPTIAEYMLAHPTAPLFALKLSQSTRRERFARTGAVYGALAAGLALGGAIGIAVADDLQSERVSRGIWLGYVAVSAPLVAFSVWLARRESGQPIPKGLRQLGWMGYALAVSDGALLWSSAFQHETSPRALTIAAGIFGAMALLPHALDAVGAARSLRVQRVNKALNLTSQGFVLKF